MLYEKRVEKIFLVEIEGELKQRVTFQPLTHER